MRSCKNYTSQLPQGLLLFDLPLTDQILRARVLVVDDSPTVLSLLRAALEAHQYEVATAADGVEALEGIRISAPDLIVTDSIMPGLDGFALLTKLRAAPETRRIPVIMLTSDPDDPRPGGLGESVQPDAIIIKSAQMEPLLEQIRGLLQRSSNVSL
jgi:CheY-like chemotaxis protein